MADDLPAPLTPADCDLRDFSFMPLDVVRLRDSDLAALESPEACWAAVLLWAASWHQVPAASLPDDDRVLSQFAGYGRVVREWQRVRAGALRGWVACSDGRLYHPVVADKAVEAWEAKLRRMWATECARIKKSNERHRTNIEAPTFLEFRARRLWITADAEKRRTASHAGQVAMSRGTETNVPRDTPPERPGHGLQGTGTGISIPLTPLATAPPEGQPEAGTAARQRATVTAIVPTLPPLQTERPPGVGGMRSLESVLTGIVLTGMTG
jgi:hypothetical protein